MYVPLAQRCLTLSYRYFLKIRCGVILVTILIRSEILLIVAIGEIILWRQYTGTFIRGGEEKTK